MRTANELLGCYARSHRDERNIASHFLGIPLIILSIGILAARPTFLWGGLLLSPAWLGFVPVVAWYLTRGNLSLGLAVSGAMALLLALAQRLSEHGVVMSLTFGVALFVLGCAVQWLGHWYEGKRPALLDDATHALVGPMFLVAEALFALGWNPALRADIERQAGPVTLRDLARIA